MSVSLDSLRRFAVQRQFPEPASLERALALPGAQVAAGSVLMRAVAFGREVWRDG